MPDRPFTTAPRRRLRAFAVAVPTALALALAPATGAFAGGSGWPQVIGLAPVTAPEGIAAGRGTTFYAGDREGGDIVVGDVRTGTVRTLVAADGGVAVGLAFDRSSGLIWVAGGPTGTITAYRASTGEQVYRASTGGGFLNDVALTRDAVYVTDSAAARLYVVPLGRRGMPAPGTAAQALPVTGAFSQPTGPGAFGLNGIRTLPGGRSLIAVDSSSGDLLRIDARTGVAEQIPVSGGELAGGDGLVLQGNRLDVVRGFGTDSIVRLTLSRGGATVVGELTDPDFQTPTTAARIAGDLYAANGQFTLPGTPTEVVRVDGS